MVMKQLRTVKKGRDTGRLNRAEVRAAVIAARDRSAPQDERVADALGTEPIEVLGQEKFGGE